MVLAGVVALGVMVYVGRLWAQQTGGARTAAPEPRTRVALLNLTYVVKNYKKYQTFQEEIKKAIDPYQLKDAGKKKEAEALAKEAQLPATTAERRAAIEKQMRTLQRELEDNKAEAKAFLDKKSDDQLKILYMDVQAAAHRYALAHNFELVLHYNDATTPEEFHSPQNIARKMQAGACMPLYAAPGMDISNEVVTALNAAYPGTAATTAPAAGSGSSRQ